MAKFGALRSIGHNIADSLGSGIGLMIGVYQIDIFGEAARSPEGFITIDFLSGTTSGGHPSASLARAISLYAAALVDLCRKHGTSIEAFGELKARFSLDSHGRRFVVTIRDVDGRGSTDEYLGLPGRRVMEMDELGRVRPKKIRQRPQAQ
ncbi:MAG: hypothetical protein ABL957_04580 [Parvularculaceae bacterium]